MPNGKIRSTQNPMKTLCECNAQMNNVMIRDFNYFIFCFPFVLFYSRFMYIYSNDISMTPTLFCIRVIPANGFLISIKWNRNLHNVIAIKRWKWKQERCRQRKPVCYHGWKTLWIHFIGRKKERNSVRLKTKTN